MFERKLQEPVVFMNNIELQVIIDLQPTDVDSVSVKYYAEIDIKTEATSEM